MKLPLPKCSVSVHSPRFAWSRSSLILMAMVCALSPAAHAADWFSMKNGDNFKRFSVSAGWLHGIPQGSANNFTTDTALAEGTQAGVGAVTVDQVVNSVDTSTPRAQVQQAVLQTAAATDLLGLFTFRDQDGTQFFNADTAGTAIINNLSSFASVGTGLTVDDIDTLGLTFNYNFTDNVSVQLIGGFPPVVDIAGEGQVFAPLRGSATPEGILDLAGVLVGEFPITKDIFVTDLSSVETVANARAWTPALELQYQFGQSGVNKFRPYLGAGLMYGYFNELDINNSIEQDLIAAGDLVQNVRDDAAGRSLDGLPSSANSKVELDASDAIGPIVSLGFTYDFAENWFAVASVSYAKLSSDITIDVVNENDGVSLFTSKTEIDIDPVLTYLGVGYRF